MYKKWRDVELTLTQSISILFIRYFMHPDFKLNCVSWNLNPHVLTTLLLVESLWIHSKRTPKPQVTTSKLLFINKSLVKIKLAHLVLVTTLTMQCVIGNFWLPDREHSDDFIRYCSPALVIFSPVLLSLNFKSYRIEPCLFLFIYFWRMTNEKVLNRNSLFAKIVSCLTLNLVKLEFKVLRGGTLATQQF